MASYDVGFDQNAVIQVGHNSGNVYYASPAPRHKIDTAFDVPDLLSSYFTGRKDELARLKEIYRASNTDGPARCVIYGMPGLGKTQLALQFAYSSKKDYSFIFWISGASIEKLNSGFSGILDHFNGEGARDESARNRVAKKWFESQEKRWLLIVDNVDEQTASHLRDILPVSNAKGNILITTRYQNVAESLKFAHGENHNTMDLQNLGENDAVELFFAIKHKSVADEVDSSEREDARIITKRVGYLPLAIDQAASLSSTPGQTVRKVLEIYSHPGSNEVFQWDSETTKHESISVMACFGPVLDQLNQSSPEAGILLRILAFLDPESLPIELVKDGIVNLKPREHNTSNHLKKTKAKSQAISYVIDKKELEDEEDIQRLRTIFESPVRLQKLIQVLRRLSIVKFKDDDNSTMWIHDLVHQLARQSLMNEDQRGRWIKIAIDIICESFYRIEDPSAVHNWKETAKFVAHVQKLREHLAIQKKDDGELITLEAWIASYLNERGSYTEAVKILERIVATRRISPGKEDPITLTNISDLALFYERQGRLREAEVMNLEALTLQKRILGSEHLHTLTTMNNLAIVYRKQERLEESQELYSETIAIYKRMLGAEHPNTLRTMANLAVSYSQQGRLKEAEELQAETLAARRRVLGAEHPDTLLTMANLAHTYSQQGRLKEAEELQAETLAIRKRVLGVEHPDTLGSMNNLAVVYRKQERLKESQELYSETIAIRKRVLGVEHPDTLGSMNNLAIVYRKQERLEESQELYLETIAIYKRVLGVEHPDTLGSMHNYSTTLEAIGKSDQAIELMETVLRERSRLLGVDHYTTQKSARRLVIMRDNRDLDSDSDDDRDSDSKGDNNSVNDVSS